jgi:transposase
MKVNGRNNKNYMDLPMNLIIQDYNNGIGLRELAEKYNVSHETVRKRLIKSGIELKPKGLPKGTSLVKVDEEKLIEIYNKSHSIAEASEALGVSYTKLYATLKNLNIELIRPNIINLPIEKIVKDYNLGLTQKELAEKYGSSVMTINRRLKDQNIFARRLGPRTTEEKIKAKQEIKYVENFEKNFNEDSKEYILSSIYNFVNSYSKDKTEFLKDLTQFLKNFK